MSEDISFRATLTIYESAHLHGQRLYIGRAGAIHYSKKWNSRLWAGEWLRGSSLSLLQAQLRTKVGGF